MKFKQERISIGKDRASLVFLQNTVNVTWDGRQVSCGTGLNVSVNTAGLWTNSTESEWCLLQQGEDCLRFKLTFRDLPITQFWDFKIISEQLIDWQIDTEVEEWLHIDEFRNAVLINPRYKTWASEYEQGDFLRQGKHWQDLHYGNNNTALVAARFPTEGPFLPSLALESKDRVFLPLIQNPPQEISGHFIGLRHADDSGENDYPPGKYRTFSGRLHLFEDDYLLDAKIEELRQDYVQAVIKKSAPSVKTKRKLKVLLANLPWQRQGKSGVRAGSRWPHIKDDTEEGYLPFPFFLAYSASLLRKNGIDTNLIDAVAEDLPEELFLDKVLRKNFDYVVAETSVPSFYYDLHLLKKISESGIPVILCGPNAQIYEPEFLKNHPFVSFVMYGEYEFTLLELIKALEENSGLANVKGLIYADRNGARKNPARELFNLDDLPWPLREGLPMEKYLDAPGEMLIPSAQMLASRGCPFKCQFCLWPQLMYNGQHYRARNVKDVVDEMEYLVREKKFKSVYFDDDTFNVGKERMLSFCNEIRKRGLSSTQWAIMARPDLMDKEILENMKNSGLWAVKYGIESSSQPLVDNIGKCMDLKKSEEMIMLTKGLGIRVHLTFTFGLPGETRDTIRRTIDYARKLDPFSVQFSITTPFPGTAYYRLLDAQDSIIEKNLSYYDGHFKSVIKLKNLNPGELEIAKAMAYRVWADHQRKKRGFWGDVKRFNASLKNKGFLYSLNKTLNYLKYVCVDKRRFLDPKQFNQSNDVA